MAEKNPNKLYDRIKTIKGSLESILSTVESIQGEVKELLADSADFGGVISKVFKEQLAKYFLPELEKITGPVKSLAEGDRVPGSLKDLVVFLDSVPLAMVREEPSVTELASPVVPENANIEAPVGESKVENEIDAIPENASYQTGIETVEPEEAEIVESNKGGRAPFLKLREFLDWDKDEDQEKWRNSPQGKAEGEWWLNHCHIEDENRFQDKGTWSKIDAEKSLKQFGKIFIDDKTDKPVSPGYAKSLIQTWGEPKASEPLTEAKDEPQDGEIPLFQVIRTSSEGSLLGEDVANLEDTVVYEFDFEDDAKIKADELNSTVTPEEKELLGTEYKVLKREIETDRLV